ncbi:MAG: phosphoglucosamine mutase [Candidatus Thermoplasmatota archaeon]|nr:phosphoglucosamine mutase [Candidatus Thermoplasmatota archaeon]
MTRLFGTNGIRGIVGEEMTPDLAHRVGRAAGFLWRGQPVAVGNDTRTSGPMLKAALIAGLTAAGCQVSDLGRSPSPGVQLYVKEHDVVGGVIVTASHNPPEFNGLKVLDAEGMELPRTTEEEIERLYFENAFEAPSWNTVGEVYRVRGANRRYRDAILEQVDREAIRKRAFRVVLDCANGASSFTSPYVLRALGCRVLTLNAQPDGTFPGHPPEPRPEHLEEMTALVGETGADLGAAHDGDADRVIFADEEGGYVYGDRSLALVAGHVVAKAGGGTVVTPVSSSSCVEDAVRAAGGQVTYTPVGAPLVARKMFEVHATFGGEENGGLIFPQHQYTRDGALGLAVMLEILASGMETLSARLRELPTYHLVKGRLPCPPGSRDEVMDALARHVAGRKVDRTDGLKVFYDAGWVLVRPSGTEAIIRVFAEGKTPRDAQRLYDEVMGTLEETKASL